METLLRWYQNVIYAADKLAAFELHVFKLQAHFCAGVKWDLKNRSLAFEINTTLSILLQAPTSNV